MLIVSALSVEAQKVTFSGTIKDGKTGEVLIGAAIYNLANQSGTITNNYGFYSLTIPKTDSVQLAISYLGYQMVIIKRSGSMSFSGDISLDPIGQTLNEVVVNARRNDNNIKKARMGTIDIPLKQSALMPSLAGANDVLKVIQLLPGVQSGKEGTTGFQVRGGNTDQNLIQLDEATIYNPNHLFGLFSSFNNNALNNVSLIKGGFPAEYGGRLSSILEITMKEGNKKNFSGQGGIGLLSADLTLEGPIVKDKGSFIISARRSYIDLLLKPFIPKSMNNTTYYFYDLNAKLNYTLSKKDRLYLSFFTGLDNARYTGASSLNYGTDFGNVTGTVRWNHLFSDRIFINTSLIYNDYHNSLSTVQGKYFAQLYSGIRDMNAKTDISIYPNDNHTIKLGVNYSNNTFFPATVSSKIKNIDSIKFIRPDSIPRKFSHQTAIYISDEIKASDKISIYLGVRVPLFVNKEINYFTWEPRAILKYSLSSTTSIKASYTKMNQFLHLVPSSTASLPTDIWISSSKIVKPEVSQQVAIGIFKNFQDNNIEASLEIYYKTMKNQVLFKEGSQPLVATNLDEQLTFGQGVSYGAEFFLKKNFGRFTGWVSYTLSWTNQLFASLNYGNPFPYAYDKRHNFSIVGTYKINEKWTVSADWVFTSGGAYTLPLGRVSSFQDGSLYDGTYYDYTTRNNYRYRPYHRLDVNFIRQNKTRKILNHAFESTWEFGVYNLYSRMNPYFVYLTKDPITQLPQAKEVSLLPIIPSVSWKFNF